jgi:hypothetical protein
LTPISGVCGQTSGCAGGSGLSLVLVCVDGRAQSPTNEIPGASARLSDIIQRSGQSTNARYLRLIASIVETDASPGSLAFLSVLGLPG